LIHSNKLPDFNDPELALTVETLTEEEIDALPFGAIRLDESGVVRFFSRAERRQSGYGERPAPGLDFFTKIAPCMANDDFRGRIERARAAGKLDIEFSHVGDFADLDRELSVKVQSASDGGYWIFLKREG
jgi:photoactive yellow protein